MKQIRTRKLALRDEGARHPFRLTLPRETFQIALEEVAAQQASAPPKFWQKEDAQLFAFSFVAFFTAFYLFIF